MPRKVSREPVRALTVELPQSEFEALERYCLQRQETGNPHSVTKVFEEDG